MISSAGTCLLTSRPLLLVFFIISPLTSGCSPGADNANCLSVVYKHHRKQPLSREEPSRTIRFSTEECREGPRGSGPGDRQTQSPPLRTNRRVLPGWLQLSEDPIQIAAPLPIVRGDINALRSCHPPRVAHETAEHPTGNARRV